MFTFAQNGCSFSSEYAAIIVGRVTVDENSVVAAGSVVTKDVPSNKLVAGDPAKVIRSMMGIEVDFM
ncbi:TPA: hypothetical protein I8Z67_002984 [Legionella pneumophila]|nr:hypothetical protein [Legionella pneumophila]